MGLPAECQTTRCSIKQAGRPPLRCRLLLSGTFKDEAANDRAKKAVRAWRKELTERLKGLGIVEGDPIENMPLSQVHPL